MGDEKPYSSDSEVNLHLIFTVHIIEMIEKWINNYPYSSRRHPVFMWCNRTSPVRGTGGLLQMQFVVDPDAVGMASFCRIRVQMCIQFNKK